MYSSNRNHYNQLQHNGPGVLLNQVVQNLNNDELRKYEMKGMKNKRNGKPRRVIAKSGKMNNYQELQGQFLQQYYDKGYDFKFPQLKRKSKKRKRSISVFNLPNEIIPPVLKNPRIVHQEKMISKIRKMKNIESLNKTYLRFMKTLLKNGKSKIKFKSVVGGDKQGWIYHGWKDNIPMLSYNNRSYNLRYIHDLRHEHNWDIEPVIKDKKLTNILLKYWMFGVIPSVKYNDYFHNYYGNGYSYINENGNTVSINNKFIQYDVNPSTHKICIDKKALRMINNHIIEFADFVYTYLKGTKVKYEFIFLDDTKGESFKKLESTLNILLKYT